MPEVEVLLQFCCCTCGGPMGVTLRCEGEGLNQGKHAKALVGVACPACHRTNQVIFRPEDGRVIDVMREVRNLPNAATFLELRNEPWESEPPVSRR